MTAEQISKLNTLGVDLDETLERFVENEALYIRCLNKLVDDKNYECMLNAVSTNDPQTAFDAAHALKGVSANLGLDHLYKEMKVITEVFRAGSMDYDKANMENIKAYYIQAIDTIKSL